MFVLKKIKNIPRSPPIGRQALSIIFFLQICNEVPGKKMGGLSPPLGQPLGPAHGRGRGACRPPRATGVTPLYKIQL